MTTRKEGQIEENGSIDCWRTLIWFTVGFNQSNSSKITGIGVNRSDWLINNDTVSLINMFFDNKGKARSMIIKDKVRSHLNKIAKRI